MLSSSTKRCCEVGCCMTLGANVKGQRWGEGAGEGKARAVVPAVARTNHDPHQIVMQEPGLGRYCL